MMAGHTRSRYLGRILAGAALVLGLVPAVALSTAQPAAAVANDHDGDGLDDTVEDALAARFFPWVWYDEGEDWGCTHPATGWNPGTALARVRPHPQNPAHVAIQYVILYRKDCGDIAGAFAHSGDVEPFAMTLAPNPACPYGYGALAIKTVAHQGESLTEGVDQRLLGNSCTWGRLAGDSAQVANIYASENKHASYLSTESCGTGGFATSDHCSEEFTLPFNVYNVGEDHHRRIDALDAYQFANEFAWTPEPFSGGIGAGGNAGLIRDKFLNDSLLALANEPPPSNRCNQPATAWYQTPGNNQHIAAGQNLLVIAAGVQPDTVAQFIFTRAGAQIHAFQTRWANGNCVINQEYMPINPSVFTPGTYQVRAIYKEPVDNLSGALLENCGVCLEVTRVKHLPDLTVQGPPSPVPPAACTAINPGEGLHRGQSQVSCDGRFTLAMQHDGNLVLYRSGAARWASNTGGSAADRAIMQNDGNFVVYTAGGAALWATGTTQPGSRVWVQNDGNVVVYTSSMTPVWATNTVEPPPPPPPPPHEDPPDGGDGGGGRCRDLCEILTY